MGSTSLPQANLVKRHHENRPVSRFITISIPLKPGDEQLAICEVQQPGSHRVRKYIEKPPRPAGQHFIFMSLTKGIHIVPLADVQHIFDSIADRAPPGPYIYIHNDKDHPVKVAVKGLLGKQWKELPSGSVWYYSTASAMEVYFKADGHKYSSCCDLGCYTMTDFDWINDEP